MIGKLKRLLARLAGKGKGSAAARAKSEQAVTRIKAASTRARPSPSAGRPAPESSERQVAAPYAPQATKSTMVNVGVDFGTSSTKVVVRDIYADRGHVLAHKDHIAAFGPFCWPSTIAVAEGKLHFGVPAERLRGTRALRSFKICVGCRCGIFSVRHCRNRTCLDHGRKPGVFELVRGVMFAAEELATLYLANLLGDVHEVMATSKAFHGNLSVSYNLSAPLDHVESEAARTAFERIIYAAHLLSGGVPQGIDAPRARDLLDKLRPQIREMPEPSQRTTFVTPETHAAMVGHIYSGSAEPGRYMIVDVGAGTTDVSLFNYSHSGIAYYSAMSKLLGGDDIDVAIAGLVSSEAAGPTRTELLATVRQAKHKYSAKRGMTVNGTHLTAGDVLGVVKPVVDALYGHYRASFYEGFKKEKNHDLFRELVVAPIGGTCALPFVRDLLSVPPNATGEASGIRRVHLFDIRLPASLAVLGPATKSHLAEYSDVLLIAHGLSFHPGEVPPITALPKEIAESRPKKIIERPTPDEDPG